jgi:hypothetical protein
MLCNCDAPPCVQQRETCGLLAARAPFPPPLLPLPLVSALDEFASDATRFALEVPRSKCTTALVRAVHGLQQQLVAKGHVVSTGGGGGGGSSGGGVTDRASGSRPSRGGGGSGGGHRRDDDGDSGGEEDYPSSPKQQFKRLGVFLEIVDDLRSLGM